MTKPQTEGADRRLLEAAKAIVHQHGLSGLRVREVAARADVNLGLFHYHFKTKQRFSRILLQEFYEDFFSRLSVAAKEGKTGQARLRSTLIAISGFLKAENEFYLALLKDILNQNPEVIEFVRENLPRHAAVLRDLIVTCQEEGSLIPLPLPQTLAFLMASINGPILIGYAATRRGAKRRGQIATVLTDEAIAQRIDLALKGLQP